MAFRTESSGFDMAAVIHYDGHEIESHFILWPPRHKAALTVKNEIARIKDYFRGRGIRLTPKRLRIIEAVFQTHDHFDAEEMFLTLSRDDRRVSRATVYRTLEILVEGGFVLRNRFQEGFDRFEHVLGHSPHGHLVCLECQGITEFEEPRLNAILKRHAEGAGFVDKFHITQVFGLCPVCRKLSN